MCAMTTRKLSVRLFGGFSAIYGDEALTFGKQANSKCGQLFQILMTRPGEDFSKSAVIEQLYEPGGGEAPNASFQNTLLRLRKYLDASPLPAGEYLTVTDGSIRFEGPVEVESDAWTFEQLADAFEKETDTAKRASLCGRACELYQGDFLPQLSEERWVIRRNQYYQERYFKMLRYLVARLKEKGDYVTIGRLALRATQIEPIGEWLSWRIESLVAQGRSQDAVRAYQAAERYVDAMGDSAPREFLEQLSRIATRLQIQTGARAGTSSQRWEEAVPQSASYCSLPSFVERYQILKQTEKHSATPFVLMLCTIQNDEGYPMNVWKSDEEQGANLQEAFQLNLRAGDFYVRYNRRQYLMLCVGTELENIPEIATRIDVDFRKRCYGQYILHYRLLDHVSVFFSNGQNLQG